jgi:hypothetical protein
MPRAPCEPITTRSTWARLSFLNISVMGQLPQHELLQLKALQEGQLRDLVELRLDLVPQALVLRVEIRHLLVHVHDVDARPGQPGQLGGHTQGIGRAVREIVGNKDGLHGIPFSARGKR